MSHKSFSESKSEDGTGKSFGHVEGERALVIYWRGENGVTPLDVIKVTRRRMESEQRGGPFADLKNAKAIAFLMQAEAELTGDRGPDGLPILGATE
jgi:hypothetical protein